MFMDTKVRERPESRLGTEKGQSPAREWLVFLRGRSVGYLAKLTVHLALVFCAFLLAYELRRGLSVAWWVTNPQALTVLVWAALYAAVAGAVEFGFRTERASWRFSSLREVIALARSAATVAVVFLVITFLSDRAILLPRSTLILSALLSLCALVTVRIASRLIHGGWATGNIFVDKANNGSERLTVVGDLREAELFLRRSAVQDVAHYRPVAIIGRSMSDVGQFIHGVPVVGCADDDVANRLLKPAISGTSSTAVLFLEDPIKQLGLSTEDIGHLKARGFKLLRQSNLLELQGDDNQGRGLREMKLEEFLPRAPVGLAREPIATLVAGKRVLVTGAGGSIGSEIARQLVAFGCSHITLLDHSEFLLFEIDREIERIAPGGCTRRAILCNVREEDRVREVFSCEHPEIVFHAAALKHLTLVENNVCEGVLTNIIGTWNVAAAARECGSCEMVTISTDKAVDPTSMMGATKRIAEALLPAHAGGHTGYTVVRFGNVLGSAGSVVPIFKDQIERGGPVTVTHEDVERFFMTIPEAVQLVLHATALRSGRSEKGLSKFILEMGEPVKIADIARKMIELSGNVPDVDIAVKITGLRPGEKLTEKLIDANEVGTPCVPGITEVCSVSPEGVIGRFDVLKLATTARAGDAQAVCDLIASNLLAVREPCSLLDSVRRWDERGERWSRRQRRN
jgi:O-antigen biosynthesis protein WbqV